MHPALICTDITNQVAQTVKNLPTEAGDVASIPGSGRCPEEGNGNLLQNSCLGNPMERGAWRATVHGVAKSRTQLSDYHFHLHPKCLEEFLGHSG